MIDLSTRPPRLLSDDQVLRFITHGYHLLHPEYPAGLNEAISGQCGQVNGVGNEILASVPLLHQVYAHPEVRGALISLLGSRLRDERASPSARQRPGVTQPELASGRHQRAPSPGLVRAGDVLPASGAGWNRGRP